MTVELLASEVIADPPLDELAHRKGVPEYTASWCDQMASIGALLHRVSDSSVTFQHVRQDEVISSKVSSILTGVTESCIQCAKLLDDIGQFDFLVLSDIEKSFAAYEESKKLPSPVQHCVANTPENPTKPRLSKRESVAFASALFGRLHDLASLGETPDPTFPTIEEFDAFLSVFATAASDLAAMDSCTPVQWICVNVTPAKTALMSWASNWIYKFGSVVLERLQETIATIREYFTRTEVNCILNACVLYHPAVDSPPYRDAGRNSKFNRRR